MLPSCLSSAVAELIRDVRPRDLRDAATRVSERYAHPHQSLPAVRSRVEALAYCGSRLPATFAAAHAVFREVAGIRPGWEPQTILDLGAGPGTATWAALDVWSAVSSSSLVEPNRHMAAAGQRIDASMVHPSRRVWLNARLDEPQLTKADLVVASYVLGEEPDAGLEVVQRIWALTGQMLVVVEPGTPAGFALLRQWRTSLVKLGGTVVAPCTHNDECPMQPGDWCHFSERLQRGKLHRYLKGADMSYEDEKYTYLAVARTGAPPGGHRVVRPPRRRRGLVTLSGCSSQGIETVTVSRRHPGYDDVRRLAWGSRFVGTTTLIALTEARGYDRPGDG